MKIFALECYQKLSKITVSTDGEDVIENICRGSRIENLDEEMKATSCLDTFTKKQSIHLIFLPSLAFKEETFGLHFMNLQQQMF